MLNTSDFDLWRDVARALHAVPQCLSLDEDGTLRVLANVGSDVDYASEFADALADECILKRVELDADSDELALLLCEPIAGHERYVQLVLRSPLLRGSALVEGHVWPVGTTQAEAVDRLKALAYTDSSKEGDNDGVSEDEPLDERPAPRAVNSAAQRPRVVRKTAASGGFFAWLRRNF